MVRIAFLFPGQAAHEPEMASRWAGRPEHAVFTAVGREAGLDLAVLADDAEACRRTAVAQPAIHAASLAAMDALVAAGVTPDVVAGHSLGEITAAVAAGVLDRGDGARLVGVRGRAFGEACETRPGTMAAVVRLDLDDLEPLVADIPDLVVANVNAPGQVVVSGSATAITTLTDVVADRRARVLPLDVEGAFHSPAMTSAVPALVIALDSMELAAPDVRFVSGIDGRERTTAAEVSRSIVDGVRSPVRWVAVQQRLAELADVLVEVGPGGILAGCARRTVPDLPVVTVAGPDDVATAVDRLRELAPAPA